MAHDVLTPELEREIAEARRAAAEAAAKEPRATTAHYDAGRHEVVIEFVDGARLAIPANNIQGLEEARPEDLAQVEVTPSGSGIHWEALDVDMSVPGLVAGVFGTGAWMAELGRKGGSATSDAKVSAARANGRKGGRPRNTSPSPTRLWSNLKRVGLERDFVVHRLLPEPLASCWSEGNLGPDEGKELALETATAVGHIYGWEPADLFSTIPLSIDPGPSATAWFKVPKRANERRLSAYTFYAHYLSLLALQVTQHLVRIPIPTDYRTVRSEIGIRDSVTFREALQFVWKLGVPVLPLSDSGAFHGACWRTDGRNVIVLKQGNLAPARWLMDLLHETYHAGDKPEREEFAVVEEPELSPQRLEAPEERAAHWFAWNVIFAGRQEVLAEQCVKEAGGQVAWLKNAVPRVAQREGVAVDQLAVYMAYRLTLQGENWWGAATNLQDTRINPWEISRDMFLEHAELERLSEPDRSLLQRALGR